MDHDDPPASSRDFVLNWLDLHLSTGKVSNVLVDELVACIHTGRANFWAILDEIGALEARPTSRPSSTKPASRFQRPPLKGLLHKHFKQTSVTSIATNVLNHWNGHMQELVKRYLKHGVTEHAVAALAHELVIGGYEGRHEERKITGEWIVYVQWRGANHYLTLGEHGDDAAVARRVEACLSEFPFLTDYWTPPEH